MGPTVLLIWTGHEKPWRCSPSHFVTHKIYEMHLPWSRVVWFPPARISSLSDALVLRRDWASRVHPVIPTNTAQLFRGQVLETQTHSNLSGKVLRWLIIHQDQDHSSGEIAAAEGHSECRHAPSFRHPFGGQSCLWHGVIHAYGKINNRCLANGCRKRKC